MERHRPNRRLARLVVVLLGLALPAAVADELNLFEWTGVAPVVARAEVVGVDGRHVELRLDRIFRGSLPEASSVYINLKQENRRRNRVTHERGIRLAAGENYVVLLEATPSGAHGALPIYRLARGIAGLQTPPLEGAQAYFDALQAFVEIHDLRSDNGKWIRFATMLDAANPILVETALAQFLKFRRGQPELVTTARPLLDHPRADIRSDATRLLGQLLERWGSDAIPEATDLRSELIAIARRDALHQVRIEATRALSAFSDEATDAIFEEIASTDPEQDVRYHAERLLYERRLKKGAARR